MYSTILLPVDLADEHSWKKPLPAAVVLCRTFNAALHIVTVAPEFGQLVLSGYFPPDYEAKRRRELSDQLRDFVAERVPAEIQVTPHVAEGAPYLQILRLAQEIGADLIVMGSHRPELRDYLLGPNAAKVVRHATCSVMVVRE
ncbi:MAG TPA: universal stress protein [Geminicoccaceae bacterium]|nr:universal stress protein [Geminicoccaceae bacterium]